MGTVYEPYVFNGGVYKHGRIIELLEDVGGYLVNKMITITEVTMDMVIPEDDVPLIEELAKKQLGTLTKSPLTGVEIAVVSPTLASHHLPHSACDIAEYLRHPGAKTTMIGLARGMGRRVSLNDDFERKLINEHDIALYCLGSFKDCIVNKKPRLFEGVEVPIVATGGPEDIDVEEINGADMYIGSMGRLSHRMRSTNEINALDTMNDRVAELVEEMRRRQSKDPPAILPARAMKEIENQIPEIGKSLAPSPLVLKISGVRVKLPYDLFHERVRNVEFDEGPKLGEIADITRSKMNDYILVQIKPKSEVGFEI
ncbi:methanogenesis marker 7 protein [Methanimicrococcus blatticola]|uniref:Putative methanogenesis marker protein 7 n=1 Tax=Methanimicrococcus blatticola TaxID=91560 RepID=A0A484F4E4_9EURY|nr:methanogenesis marker 7 protein [Methanimicrococcus blatticola]MBZ3935663.1 methanogenesis marker 7 protein [Methanimicrococcus blatticola]MCC2508216.1 methanogenesis marker 7 protein [Methanimicrococcus blatticola]TDQ68706.1 putative methanogenesis marker protein 7 [Methanimicrococcus blatticola]